ncbi:membrane hypothetical protein [Microbacterium sp. C448]|uniref:hypothetical protein n=1 Tax=Microbacterium sp. C448 TaxID=1177594 RepID=UPI0003DE68CF|nr:hypothetical protein [Microbacterium sp. C448]CDJ99134.1 membrane hypothetical protein [Microbacterium sp. C448]
MLWARVVAGTVMTILASGVALVGVASASAASASQPVTAAVEGPLACDDLLSPGILADVAARGFVPTENATPLFPAEGRQCWWADPNALRGQAFAVGYIELTPEQAAAEGERLLATGRFARVDIDGTNADVAEGADVIYRAIPAEFTNMAEEVDPSFRFHYADGYWFFVYDPTAQLEEGVEQLQAVYNWGDVLAADLQSNVLAAFVAEPAVVEEETEFEPIPAPTPDGFSATTPSTLSGLRTAAEVDFGPAAVGGCIAAALVLVALIGLPGRLVDSALSARYDEWGGMLRPVFRPLRMRMRALARAVENLPTVVVVGGGVVLAALFAAVVEPDFGLNGGSVRLLLSLVGAFLIENVAGLVVLAWWLGRRGAPARLRLRLGSLLVVLVTALASRVAGFDPGFVFGLVFGLAFVGEMSARRDGNGDTPSRRDVDQALGEATWLLIAGVTSWLVYSVAVGLAFGTTGGMIGLLVVELFAGLAVGCLAALFLVLLPLPGLIGATLWAHSRIRWAIAEAVAIGVFLFIVLPLPASWTTVDTPFALWVAMFAIYAVLAVALWAVLTYTPSRWIAARTRPEVPGPSASEALNSDARS